MTEFKAQLQKFGQQGEKTGWTYVEIPASIAGKLKSGFKKSFRIKGKIDACLFTGVAILPMGAGDFILPVNGAMRKKLRKFKGDTVVLKIEEDKSPVRLSADLLACLEEDKKAKTFFDTLPGSHRNYFSKWIESAKTAETKAKRIAMAMNAFAKKMGYAEMLRASKRSG